MTTAAGPYWRAARRSIELPDGPSVINEAQYASLMFELKCTACGIEDTDLRFTQAYARFCEVCYALNIRSREDIYSSLHPKTILKCEGLDFGFFASEFEMVLPRSIETHMIRRASRPGRDGWFYFPEFEAVVEEYTRLKRDPEALKAFIEARKLAVRENLEFRARRGKWLGAHDAKDRARKVRQKQREVEFLAVFREHLPEYSEQNPLLPPDEVVLREVEGLSEFLMEQDGVIPVTSERVRKISGLLVAHCEAFNRKIRRMMVVISKRIPMDQPFTMTDDECREYLGRATTIFIVAIERQQLWYTHQSFALTMRHIREKKVLFGMLDDFYVNEDYSEHIGALLEYMGLLRTATLDAALAKQEELKVVCQCKSTDFEQPASFLGLGKAYSH